MEELTISQGESLRPRVLKGGYLEKMVVLVGWEVVVMEDWEVVIVYISHFSREHQHPPTRPLYRECREVLTGI